RSRGQPRRSVPTIKSIAIGSSEQQPNSSKEEIAMSFRINHLHLKTPDPKKTAEFYVEYTGAKIVKENIRPDGSKNYRLDLHGVELNVTEFLTEQKLSQFYGLEHVAIDTNNFDGEANKVKSAGLKILEE